MADENLVPETLATIAAQISELAKRVDTRFDVVDARFDAADARFDAVDARFNGVEGRLGAVEGRLGAVEGRLDAVDGRLGAVDARFDKVESRITEETAQTRSLLGVKIEAVHAEVKLVYDEVIAQREKHEANDKDHKRFREHIAKHDLQLQALTPRKSRGRK